MLVARGGIGTVAGAVGEPGLAIRLARTCTAELPWLALLAARTAIRIIRVKVRACSCAVRKAPRAVDLAGPGFARVACRTGMAAGAAIGGIAGRVDATRSAEEPALGAGRSLGARIGRGGLRLIRDR